MLKEITAILLFHCNCPLFCENFDVSMSRFMEGYTSTQNASPALSFELGPKDFFDPKRAIILEISELTGPGLKRLSEFE